MKTNTLICGDDMYHMDAAYRAGARAMRQLIPYSVANPYRDGTQQHDQFDYGHVNESAGEHIRFGVDVIEVAATGRCFEEDQSVPRDEYSVDRDWYAKQLALRTSPCKLHTVSA